VAFFDLAVSAASAAFVDSAPSAANFPPPLDSYPAQIGASLLEVMVARVHQAPFNAVATGIFALAVLHTFAANRFRALSHDVQERFNARCLERGEPVRPSIVAEVLHFFAEVEVVFGLWAVVLVIAITLWIDWPTARTYLTSTLDFSEAMFVVVIMAMAATKPVIGLAETGLGYVASLGARTPAAWWLAILIVGPILGSFITEPAAMTICALLLSRQFYRLNPGVRLKYATLGLLFVNVSIGGTLTEFAAPPVLMVARTWDWTLAYMLTHFGWKALVSIGLSTVAYFMMFRAELRQLGSHERPAAGDSPSSVRALRTPAWIVLVHIAFLIWTVVQVHYPVLFIGGFLFFLGFAKATSPYQTPVDLRAPLLVGFFLAGLVVHGRLQGWWIAPALDGLTEMPLFFGATLLTAFNDNALITYLATLVPNLSEPLRYAVVAGAVAGGGLTVIANAPNPAGQALLGEYFNEGVSPIGLLGGAVLPTAIALACFAML
jgi:hypothetical protein